MRNQVFNKLERLWETGLPCALQMGMHTASPLCTFYVEFKDTLHVNPIFALYLWAHLYFQYFICVTFTLQSIHVSNALHFKLLKVTSAHGKEKILESGKRKINPCSSLFQFSLVVKPGHQCQKSDSCSSTQVQRTNNILNYSIIYLCMYLSINYVDIYHLCIDLPYLSSICSSIHLVNLSHSSLQNCLEIIYKRVSLQITQSDGQLGREKIRRKY